MAGPVTEYLTSQLADQIRLHGVVVWYDPDEAYAVRVKHVGEVFQQQGVLLKSYDGSFFDLRKEIDEVISGVDVPKLLVYVPKDRSDCEFALVEVESLGVTVQPGEQPPTRNTRLSIVARNALSPIIGDAQAEELQQQIEAGNLTLSELDELGEKGATSGVTTVVFGTSSLEEKILRFLATDHYDDPLTEKDGLQELGRLLRGYVGLSDGEMDSAGDLRAQAGRHILVSDLAHALADEMPDRLSSVPRGTSQKHLDNSAHIARVWRLRSDLRQSYEQVAMVVEDQLDLGIAEFEMESLQEAETFLAGDKALQGHVVALMLEGRPGEATVVAHDRLSRFWSEVRGEVQAEWALLHSAAELLSEVRRVRNELQGSERAVDDLIAGYAKGDRPWCYMDTLQRHVERRHLQLSVDINERSDQIEKLVVRCRREYMVVSDTLAKIYASSLEESNFEVSAHTQRAVFDRYVKPHIGKVRLAYILVDALRYEMARELLESVSSTAEAILDHVLGTPPTITQVGMSSLVVRENDTYGFYASAKSGLRVTANAEEIVSRSARIQYFGQLCGASMADVRLAELLPNPAQRIRDRIEKSQVVLVTSQEIDEIGESGNAQLARTVMDAVLHELRRAITVLFGLGIERVVVTADHGHLFGDELDDDMKLDAPGGETIELHRRAWIGRGGTSNPSYLRVPLAKLGIHTDLDLVTPRGVSIFKAPGTSTAYLHGGLSLQEHVVPVLTIRPNEEEPQPPSDIAFTIQLGSGKISTRFLSVRISGASESLFDIELPVVRVEVRARGRAVSQTVSASYGFDDSTGDVRLRYHEQDANHIEPNTVALMLTDIPDQKTVTIHMLDVQTGVQLAKLENVALDITIKD